MDRNRNTSIIRNNVQVKSRAICWGSIQFTMTIEPKTNTYTNYHFVANYSLVNICSIKYAATKKDMKSEWFTYECLRRFCDSALVSLLHFKRNKICKFWYLHTHLKLKCQKLWLRTLKTENAFSQWQTTDDIFFAFQSLHAMNGANLKDVL